MQVGVLPVVHGSALAGQGQSQALATATIGEADDQAKSEGITGHTSKQLMVPFGDRMAAAAEVSPLIAHASCAPHSASLLAQFNLVVVGLLCMAYPDGWRHHLHSCQG